jgi:hypothetical protein
MLQLLRQPHRGHALTVARHAAIVRRACAKYTTVAIAVDVLNP